MVLFPECSHEPLQDRESRLHGITIDALIAHISHLSTLFTIGMTIVKVKNPKRRIGGTVHVHAIVIPITLALVAALALLTLLPSSQFFFALRGTTKLDGSAHPRRRHFLAYHSSEWEQLWLNNIGEWERSKQICEQVQSEQQLPYLRDFLQVFCTFTFQEKTPWCYVDDGVSNKPWWFHTQTGQIASNLSEKDDPPPPPYTTWKEAVVESQTTQPRRLIQPETLEHPETVFSRMDFRNDYTGEEWTEYIEPLVSHLRHPLSFCNYAIDLSDRNFLVPPPSTRVVSDDDSKSFYFDAGASLWNAGLGGPSLSFFTSVWKRHGIAFDQVECWEGSTAPQVFFDSVPASYQNRVTYHQEWIASSPKEPGPFLPHLIETKTSVDDYVLLKLDIDNGPVEKGSVDYLLKNPWYVDEFVWEHHAGGNYLLRKHWFQTADNLSVEDSYHYFLQLRQKGIRAHSWV